MTNTLLRTGRSGVLNSARDFSACILTPNHELVVAAESLPIHVMSGPDLMSRSMVELHPDLKRGDAFLHNSPYLGGSHAADQCILVPVLDDEHLHRFTVLVKAHQADIGNSLPTTYRADARDVYEEGALIFPCVKVQERYVDNQDLLRLAMARIRVPHQWHGDYLAALGAARIGERKLLELGGEVGWAELADHSTRWFDYSERAVAAAIRGVPKARFTIEGRHDPCPGAPDGIPIAAVLTVDPVDARISVDLRDNVDLLPNGLNLSEACARTAVMVGTFNSLGPGIPPNAGSFRRLEVLLRRGSAIGGLVHPASCSVATTNVADRLANAVQRGFARLGDGLGMAEAGLDLPPSIGVISGQDPRRGDEAFINEIHLLSTGGAGSAWSDGWLTLAHVGNAGVVLRDSVELDESRFPIRVVAQRLLPDTEGAGRLRGAPSALVEFGPTAACLDVMYASDGSLYPARGARGGAAGGRAEQFRRRVDGTTEPLDAWGKVTLAEGETIVSITSGGGGYGPPVERDVAAVASDVCEGLVTPERARDVYGVIVDREGRVDSGATKRLRARGCDMAGDTQERS
jgi:N-methylhydantoinase B